MVGLKKYGWYFLSLDQAANMISLNILIYNVNIFTNSLYSVLMRKYVEQNVLQFWPNWLTKLPVEVAAPPKLHCQITHADKYIWTCVTHGQLYEYLDKIYNYACQKS